VKAATAKGGSEYSMLAVADASIVTVRLGGGRAWWGGPSSRLGLSPGWRLLILPYCPASRGKIFLKRNVNK
jgi:hypothetical protein